MLFGAAALAAAGVFAPARALAAPAAPIVRTGSGPVRGLRRDTGCAYLGIPFAQPPVGDLRFAAPVPATPWGEVRDCTAYGPTAQRKQLTTVTTIPEPVIPGDNVLNLNVFTPDPSGGAKLPVLVWIHGGGFTAGCNASPWYDGAAFNRDGVVLVSIGYRLGVEGFMHLDDAPENRGVLDWIAGLQWVRDNIAAFGGDPNQVTIAGQSAGGGAVWALLGTPSARGLFRAGISVSGAVNQPNDRATALSIAADFTQRTGRPATAAALRDVSDDEMQQLQDKANQDGAGLLTHPSLMTFAPYVDGTLIPESSTQMGGGPDIPLMMGFTKHEMNAVVDMLPIPAAATGPALLATGLDLPTVAAYHAAYPGLSDSELFGQVLSDRVLRAGAYRVAEARASRGLPTWFYEFGWGDPSSQYHGQSVHCSDLPFSFDLLHAEGVDRLNGTGQPPQQLADAMHGAWVSFVRNGDPGANWPRYNLAERPTMMWSAESRVVSDPFAAQRPVWTR
ncbi:carboxylesterase family protein [Nocardia sp. SYP-A9097]|uniref:carboxylesterase/lipase family protein n=1 Tax=Nocardia sp. SYP-A9097 TaxID=2663237 RepID=UPI002815A38F|nr:carboxylesterase family protein [Nocardia sp. SYP-A9097]